MKDQISDSSEVRLSRAEYWILETAVQLRIPLHGLVAERYSRSSSIEEMFNKPGHGLSRAQLLTCLGELFQRNLIDATSYDDDAARNPTNDQIAAACQAKRFDDKAALFYGLTEVGGRVWEAFAMPKWDQFISEEYNDDHTATVTCADRQRLERYLACLALNLSHFVIHPDSAEIAETVDWQATYWKQLPHGFRASFQWSEKQPSYGRIEHLAFAGMCSFRDGWYRWS